MQKHLWSTFAIIVMALLALGSTNPPPQKPAGPKTPEQVRKEQIEKHFKWDGSHNSLTKYIKRTMNDPDSYKHVETKYSDKGDHLIVFTTFRGKNAFNATITNTIAAKIDLDGKILEIIK